MTSTSSHAPTNSKSTRFVFGTLPSSLACYVGVGAFVCFYLPLPNVILAVAALIWLCLRVNEVLKRPVDDLVKLLGLEIPPAPNISLLDITSTTVSVHWKAPEQKQAVSKYAIRVNGALVDELPSQETSITVTNLLPEHYYIIRVVAINSLNFQTPGEAPRIRTLSKPIDDGNTETSEHQMKVRPISVVQYKPSGELASNGSVAQAMARDFSGNHLLQPKRSGLLKRPSPSASHDQLRYKALEAQRHHEHGESVQQLTEKLDSLRREIHEAEKHEEEEKEDHQENSKSLAEKRETLRQQLKDRDDESKELKRIVTGLERQYTTAQSKKSAQERQLQQKFNERRKIQEDTQRWEREAKDMELEAERLNQQQQDNHQKVLLEVEAIKEQQQAEQDSIDQLEQSIQEKKSAIRTLEDQKTALDQDPDYSDVQSREQTEDAEWREKFRVLQARLSQAITEFNHAHYAATQVHYRYDWLNPRRGSQSALGGTSQFGEGQPEHFAVEQEGSTRLNMHAPPFAPSFMSQSPLPNRNPPGSNIPTHPVPDFVPSIQRSSTPQYHGPELTMSPSVVNHLTGGALTSPGADALLPSNLLGDDGDDIPEKQDIREQSESTSNFTASRTNLGLSLQHNAARESPPFRGPLPGLGVVPNLGPNELINYPTSPNSLADSRSPSLLSSPRASVTQLHQYKLSDPQADSDRRSVRSMSTSSRPPKTSRMFGPLFNRQRGKTTSEDGPALGSLKQSESQSMPRRLHPDGGVDEAPGDQQKKAGATSNFLSQVSSATTKPLSMFSSRGTPWFRNTSSTDGQSVGPFPSFPSENALPLPSADNQPFGWPSEDNISRPTSVRGGGIPGAYPSSLYSSKRHSIFEDTTESPLEDIDQLDEDSQELSLDNRSPPQAPIGTKPSKNKNSAASAAQLNPNARDFRTMFSRKSSEKTTPKAKKKDKGSSADDLHTLTTVDSSPPESRKSKEDRNSSVEDINDSLNDSGVSTPLDGTPQSGSAAKESLMRRLTRKSSSTKFMSSFSKKSTNAEETDEDGTPTKPDKSVESVTSSPQIGSDKKSSGFSLASFKSRKKKGMDAPSISETSMASETGDEDESSRPSADE